MRNINADGAVEITMTEWKKIPNDYKGKFPDGTRYAFGGSLDIPNGGTTLYSVVIVKETEPK